MIRNLKLFSCIKMQGLHEDSFMLGATGGTARSESAQRLPLAAAG